MSQLSEFDSRPDRVHSHQPSLLVEFLRSLVPLACAVGALSYLMTIPPY